MLISSLMYSFENIYYSIIKNHGIKSTYISLYDLGIYFKLSTLFCQFSFDLKLKYYVWTLLMC